MCFVYFVVGIGVGLRDRNENRQGYKKTKVGWIPQEWTSIPIVELTPFLTSGSRGWAKYYSRTGSLFIRISNLQKDSINLDLSNRKHVHLSGQTKEGIRTKLEIGDILISITADLGLVGYIESSFENEAFVNQHIALLRIKHPRACNKFIAYFLVSPYSKEKFFQINDQGAKAGLNLDSIRHLWIALPRFSNSIKYQIFFPLGTKPLSRHES